MTIVIHLPRPAIKQRVAAVKTAVETRIDNACYEHKIRKSQKKIGPYIP